MKPNNFETPTGSANAGENGASVTLSPLRSVRSSSISDRGVARPDNQDSFLVFETNNFNFYVVADGVGGSKGGATASRLAVATFRDFLEARTAVDEQFICEAVRAANRKVFAAAQDDPELRDMGTTAVILALSKERLFVANIGDSRAYCIRSGGITKLTDDHTVAAELVRVGALAESRAQSAPVSNILTRSLGSTPEVEVDCWVSISGPKKGDTYLLCSDGLYSLLGEREIVEIINNNPLENATALMVEEANKKGGLDNITVIAIEISADFPSLPYKPTRTAALDTKIESLPNISTLASRSMSVFSAVAAVGLATILGIAIGLSLPDSMNPLSLGAQYSAMTTGPETGNLDPVIDERSRLSSLLYRSQASQSSENAIEIKASNNGAVAPDIAARSVAVWFDRFKRYSRGELLALASEVAISAPTVAKAKTDYEQTNAQYLAAAEQLIYSSGNPQQERAVNELASKRTASFEKLRVTLQLAIEENLVRSLEGLDRTSAIHSRASSPH